MTQDGNTALHYAALYNQPNCLKLLLKGKATVTTGTGLGWDGFEAPECVWSSEGMTQIWLLLSPLQ